MGNEHSQLTGLEIDEKAVEVTDFWSHHSAFINSGQATIISIFIGEPVIGGSLWMSQTPLEKASKNLMIYRHPSILKYISSWNRGSKYYLAVEDVKPLSHVLAQQNSLQVCIGLFSILKALLFLHEKAQVSHNNISTSAIYVTKNGSWRLGGMEYLCHFKDVNSDYLTKIRSHRYCKSIDPNEDKHIKSKDISSDFVDVFSYGILVSEVLKSKSDDNILSIQTFMEHCKNDLLDSNIKNRPKLQTLLHHQFFNHEFIAIHSFLIELPLKTELETVSFFSNLIEKLHTFNEYTVASQLGNLLLSRMVLLNKTANLNVIPFIFTIKDDDSCTNGLFTEQIFRAHMVPVLLEVFCVRDAQIRLILLQYFNSYVHCFSQEELKSQILPELLVGIKDTNDHLVTVTLHALADLVPVLGSATVIGGKRARLFNDGRPTPSRPSTRRSNSSSSRRVSGVAPSTSAVSIASTSSEGVPRVDNGGLDDENNLRLLMERPSPDGEEDETETEEVEAASHDEEADDWDDWGVNTDHAHQLDSNYPHVADNLSLNNYVDFSDEPQSTNNTSNTSDNNTVTPSGIVDLTTLSVSQQKLPSDSSSLTNSSVNNLTRSRHEIADIFDLDIKHQTVPGSARDTSGQEIDFFQDMEPVIESSTKFFVEEGTESVTSVGLDLSVRNSGGEPEGGWDDGW